MVNTVWIRVSAHLCLFFSPSLLLNQTPPASFRVASWLFDSSPPPVACLSVSFSTPLSSAQQLQARVTSPSGSFVWLSLSSWSDREQDHHPSVSLIRQHSHSSHACLQASLFNVTLIIVTQNGHRYLFLKFRKVTARDRITILWPQDYMDYSG